ncbi:MAG: hypothetical protein K0R69_2611 [Clostridia bacterium]|jgi:hypothetical protein|nr:hypothetical protein [Clostridia bacterium]
MKHEWKKHEKEIYGTKEEPQLLQVERQKYFTIKGIGDPNGEEFSRRIEVLYSLAYAVKMMPKSGFTPDGYFEYTVYPLEGIWEAIDESINMDKTKFHYTVMIRQPDFVTQEIAEKAFEITRKKKPHELLEKVCFEEIEDGLSVQILHIGSYDKEPESFQKIKDFMAENNLSRKYSLHREIYLSDARKTATEKLKTILRYSVK